MTTTPTVASTQPVVERVPEPLDKSAEHGNAFGWTFWMLNSIEAFERLAYFGIRAVVPIYIMQATEPGGLHLTAVHKGWIYAWWAIFQSWLPMFTGGFADRFGYKRTLAFAISMNVVGFVLMAYLTSYAGFFAGILVLATGTAFFKPALQGSLAQKLDKDNASMGWGIFYWVVNVGAVCAPLLATLILGKPHSAEGWQNLFLASAAYTAMNLLLLLTFRDVPSGADKTTSLGRVLMVTIENICPVWIRNGGLVWQLRLPAFILIMSCFWLMMYQLWDLHPNFIEDWVDSSSAARRVPFESWWEYGDRGLIRVPQQILLNLNAALIVLLIIPLSWLVRRMRTLSAMLIGMNVATIGILVAGLTGNGWILLLGIVFFSLGEMLTGPKKNQYLGLIAPPGKKGLYLGYVNIPVGLGVGVGSVIAGFVYDNYGEKATLALKELGRDPQLVARAVQSVDWSDTLVLVPELAGIERSAALEQAVGHMGYETDVAADQLRAAFRWDRGQIENLALLFLAHEDHPDSTTDAFLTRLRKTVEAVKEQDAKKRPEIAILRKHLAAEAVDRAALPLAAVVDLLPKALDRSRVEAFDIVRDRLNKNRPEKEELSDGEIVAELWQRYGEDADVLNNLALEYLAQNSHAVAAEVAKMDFDKPVEELPAKAGIGRTKSFAALSCAHGATDEEVLAALADLGMDTGTPDLRPVVYLAQVDHRRFTAIAKRNWSAHKPFLRSMIRHDDAAIATVLAEIDDQSPLDGLAASVKSIVGIKPAAGEITEEGIDYTKLAEKPELIRKALEDKDWTRSPEQAARLLELNPYEARALVAAEVRNSLLTTTRMLWDTYDPQYKVWLPFAAIGVLATIALGIFGQMAKRWADMNA